MLLPSRLQTRDMTDDAVAGYVLLFGAPFVVYTGYSLVHQRFFRFVYTGGEDSVKAAASAPTPSNAYMVELRQRQVCLVSLQRYQRMGTFSSASPASRACSCSCRTPACPKMPLCEAFHIYMYVTYRS